MSKIYMALAILALGFLGKCSSANLDDVKSAAPSTWQQAGYEIIGYEGYQWGWWLWGDYGGAKVWYTLRRYPQDNGIIYSGYIMQWGDEFHIYGPDAIDAIRPMR